LSTFKILVGGHFNAGKTTFVKNASDNSLLSTEKQTTSEEERKVKASTTVAMDFASAKEGKVELKIFGIPGQERFSFMWNVLARGTQGFVFLIDSTREDMWCETVKQMKVMLKDKNVPYIICANKQDLPEAKDLQYISFYTRTQAT